MSKTHFCFGASFFLVATAGTLLFTWTCWWLAVIGDSVPARRPFSEPISGVPPLVASAAIASDSSIAIDEIFKFSLAGGWPRINSALRLVAALIAVLCSFTFAFVASLTSPRVSRVIFGVGLGLVVVFGAMATIADTVSLVRTARECSRNECVTAVPQSVIDAGDICRCSVDPWFFFTIGVDVVLTVSAMLCLLLTLVPTWRGRARNRVQ